MNTAIINLHNLSLVEQECLICKEDITISQNYKLPECNHVFHTHCIVSWFRNGDSKCPYCGNKGINYIDNNYLSSRNSPLLSWRRSRINNYKISQLKSYVKKTNSPLFLIKELKKLNSANKVLKLRNNELKAFNEKIKTDEMLYSKAIKEKNRLRNNKRMAENTILKIKQSICDLHIVPIIIPTVIDIN